MKQKKLFQDELSTDHMNSDLFGQLEVPSCSSTSSLGGNLHQLSVPQIRKLISIKYNNDPIMLIKQLSYDLELKEAELILLRKEKFVREQELCKLCTEYGNLSSLEIDQKLNSLNLADNVDDILQDLIDSAINENLKGTSSTIPRDCDTEEQSQQKPQSSIEREKETDNNEFRMFNLGTNLSGRSQNWLYNWFNSSEDLSCSHSSESVNNEEKTRLKNTNISRPFPSIFPSMKRFSNREHEFLEAKIPVELESLEVNSFKVEDHHLVDVDKYGFINDINKLKLDKNSKDKKSKIDNNSDLEQIMPSSLEKSSSSVSLHLGNSVTDLDVNGTTDTGNHNYTIDKLKEIGKLHDAKSQELENQWSTLFRELLKATYKNDKIENNNLHIASVSIGDVLTKQKEYGISDIYNSESKYHKTLRRLINKSGIPNKYRYNLWPELSGARNLKINGEYEQLIQAANTTNAKTILSNITQINLDLHRTLPSNIYFNDLINSQPGPHLNKLKRILYAFVVYRPSIGYSQGMNKIVGNLLLGDNRLTEEDIFWIFIGLVDEILPRYENSLSYFDTSSLRYIKVDQKIMVNFYFPRFMPKLAQHFEVLNIEIEFITVNWWLSLFTENFLNLEIWFKIFDNLLISDVEVKLISLSLSIFKILEKLLINLKDRDYIYMIMKNLNHNNSTKMNLKYSELIEINNSIEKKIHKTELYSLREAYMS